MLSLFGEGSLVHVAAGFGRRVTDQFWSSCAQIHILAYFEVLTLLLWMMLARPSSVFVLRVGRRM